MSDDADGKLGVQAGLAAAVAESGAASPQGRFDLGEELETAPGTGKRSGPGRPAGSINKSTAEWRDFLLEHYPSPLVGAAELLQLGPLGLAKVLGVSSDKAMAHWVALWKAFTPYVHQELPKAVELTGEGVTALILGGAPPAQAGETGVILEGEDVTWRSEDVEEIQRLIDSGNGESDSGGSDNGQ